jgi:glucose/arabinose dehydrogenase
MRRLGIVVSFAVLTVSILLEPAGVRAAPSGEVQVVVDGIDNPRNLAFDTNGDLYIPAAGHGGTDACALLKEGFFCAGLNGAILKVSAAALAHASAAPADPTPIATGLVSLAFPGGAVGHGVHGVAARNGEVYAVFIGPEFLGTEGEPGCCRDDVQGDLRTAALEQLGNLMHVGSDGSLTKVADISNYEFTYNPVNDIHTNPYAVALDGDGSFVVADAAGNTILRARPDGSVSLIAALDNLRTLSGDTGPALPVWETAPGRTEAVPTGIAVGPDGNYYVSLLAGFMHPTFARILKISPTGAVRTVADGLTGLTSVAVSTDGTVYATELPTGDLVRVRPDPNKPGSFLAPEILYRGQLVSPTGVAIGPDGMIYISDAGILPGGLPGLHGRIVRVAP